MSAHVVWDVDPVLLHLGRIEIRYYGICFGLALVTAFLIWMHRTARYGIAPEVAERFLFYAAPAAIIGGRLGHCLFYAPSYYLSQPLRMVYIWDGGMSSHGAAIALALAMWLYARRVRMTYLMLGDLFTPAVALAVGWIRIGNFFNSEVLGRPSDVPWAIIFARHDALPRHPAQLYDFAIGPLTWLVLRAVERRSVRPIGSGLIGATFLATYFGLRIIVEQFKDFYVEQLRELPPLSWIEHALNVRIHTGQWLSIIPVLIGVIVIAIVMRRPADRSLPA